MKSVKKVLNVEYDLSSADFIAQKQDSVSQEFQDRHPNDLVKVTTFCVPDKAIVVSTTQENVNFMGAAGRMLATRPLADQSILTLDDEMLKTYEITITAGTDLPDYVTAINVAQAKADEMFKEDDSKIPLVTVIDYRWGNVPATVSASLFGGLLSIGGTSSEVVIGNSEDGELYGLINVNIGKAIKKVVVKNLREDSNYLNIAALDINGNVLYLFNDENGDKIGFYSDGVDTIYYCDGYKGDKDDSVTEVSYIFDDDKMPIIGKDIAAIGAHMADNKNTFEYDVYIYDDNDELLYHKRFDDNADGIVANDRGYTFTPFETFMDYPKPVNHILSFCNIYYNLTSELTFDGSNEYHSDILSQDLGVISFDIKNFDKDSDILMGIFNGSSPWNRFYLKYSSDDDKFGFGLGDKSWNENDLFDLPNIDSDEYQNITIEVFDNHVKLRLNGDLVWESDVEGSIQEGEIWFGNTNKVNTDDNYFSKYTVNNIKYIKNS